MGKTEEKNGIVGVALGEWPLDQFPVYVGCARLYHNAKRCCLGVDILGRFASAATISSGVVITKTTNCWHVELLDGRRSALGKKNPRRRRRRHVSWSRVVVEAAAVKDVIEGKRRSFLGIGRHDDAVIMRITDQPQPQQQQKGKGYIFRD